MLEKHSAKPTHQGCICSTVRAKHFEQDYNANGFEMQWKTLALSLALSAHDAAASPAHGLMARQFAQSAMLRFQCSQLVFDRIDPLVQPGVLPSTHLHQIVGGNSFNASMPALDLDPAVKSTCTTCDFSDDLR